MKRQPDQPRITAKSSPKSVSDHMRAGPALSKSSHFSSTATDLSSGEDDLDAFGPCLSWDKDGQEVDGPEPVVTVRTKDFHQMRRAFEETSQRPPTPRASSALQTTQSNFLLSALRHITSSTVPDTTLLHKLVNDRDTLEHTVKSAYEHDLLTHIFDMMLQHGKSAQCHYVGMRLLYTTIERIPASIPVLGDMKGVQLVIHTMLLHKEDQQLQPIALAVLNRLCSHPRARELAGAFFCAEAMISAARICATCPHTQMHVLYLMKVLCGEELNRQRLLKVGAARTPVRVLKRHRVNITLVRHAADMLRTFASGVGLAAVSRLEPTAVVINALMTHLDDATLHTYGMCVISELVRDETGRRDCVAMKGVDIMARDLKRFRSSRQRLLQLSVLKAFHRLFMGGMGTPVMNAGGVDAVVMCMMEWRRDMDVMEIGIAILEEVGRMGEAGRVCLNGSGATNMLKAVLKTNLNHVEFVARGVKLLRQLRN